MFIIPFIHNIITENLIKINIIKILTIGGYQLWEENNFKNVTKDILNLNDIYTLKSPIKLNKDALLCEVDIKKTNISEFYKWEEIDIENKDLFCWRTYIYLTDDTKTCWLETPQTEMLSHYKVRDILKNIVESKR